MDEAEIRRHVHEMAERLTRISAELAVLSRRAEFEHEIRTRDYWTLVDGKQPGWIVKWNEHFEALATNPNYVRLHAERAEVRARLHSPEFELAIEGMKQGDASGAEYAIAYLEADPWYFRSGYLKSTIARRLRRISLTVTQKSRLQDALRRFVTSKGGGYEVVEMRKLGETCRNRDFRGHLERWKSRTTAERGARAALMLDSAR